MKYLGGVSIGIEEKARVRKLLRESLADWKESIYYMADLASLTHAKRMNIDENNLETRVCFDGAGLPRSLVDNPFKLYPPDHPNAVMAEPWQKVISGILGLGAFSSLYISSSDPSPYARLITCENDTVAVRYAAPHDDAGTVIKYGSGRSLRNPRVKKEKGELQIFLEYHPVYTEFPVLCNSGAVRGSLDHGLFEYRYALSAVLQLPGIHAVLGMTENGYPGYSIVSHAKIVGTIPSVSYPSFPLSGFIYASDLASDMAGKPLEKEVARISSAEPDIWNAFHIKVAEKPADIRPELRERMGLFFATAFLNYLDHRRRPRISKDTFDILSDVPVFADSTGKARYSYNELKASIGKNGKAYYVTRQFLVNPDKWDSPVLLVTEHSVDVFTKLFFKGEESRFSKVDGCFDDAYTAYLYEHKPREEPKLPKGKYLAVDSMKGSTRGELGLPALLGKSMQIAVLREGKNVLSLPYKGAYGLPLTGVINNDSLQLNCRTLHGRITDEIGAAAERMYIGLAGQYNRMSPSDKKTFIEALRTGISEEPYARPGKPLIEAIRHVPLFKTRGRRNVSLDDILQEIQRLPSNAHLLYANRMDYGPIVNRIVLVEEGPMVSFCRYSLSALGKEVPSFEASQLMDSSYSHSRGICGLHRGIGAWKTKFTISNVKYDLHIGVPDELGDQGHVYFALNNRSLDSSRELPYRNIVARVNSRDLPYTSGSRRKVEADIDSKHGRELLQRVRDESDKYLGWLFESYSHMGNSAKKETLWFVLASNAFAGDGK